MIIYNLFRHKDEADLYCAVPADRPVPTFLTEGEWEYTHSPDITALPDFDAAATSRPIRENDFFLFHPSPQAVSSSP